MKNLLLLFMIISTPLFAQKKVFAGKEFAYSIQLDSDVTYQKVSSADVLSELYVRKKDGEINYMVGMQKGAPPEGGVSSIYTDDFKQGLESTCTCEVLDAKKSRYAHIEGMRFQIRTKTKSHFVGYAVIVAADSALYQIMVLTNEGNAATIEAVATEIFNSVVLGK